MGSAALAAAVPYLGKVTWICHKGQGSTIKNKYIYIGDCEICELLQWWLVVLQGLPTPGDGPFFKVKPSNQVVVEGRMQVKA